MSELFNGGREAAAERTVTEEAAPAGELSRFLARLADKHSDADAVFSLRLAETALDTLEREPPPVAALAVVGPTQTGKSTVVNIIAGGRYVETSPLAAHTQRASVLALNTSAEDLPETYPMDPTFAPRTVESDAPACLIWDTPDFDSNASRVYRQQVARVCARVDLVVLVLSKEKYADQSVWTVLETLAPLEVPVVICLNKCDIEVDEEHSRGRSDADVLVPAIQRRLEEHPRLGGGIPVLILPQVPGGELESFLARPDVQSFRADVFSRLQCRSKEARRTGLDRLMRTYWPTWVAPVEQELVCQREWNTLVSAAVGSFRDRYRTEYIEHARHHDVARKAILGLLELLEVPALSGPISQTRRVLTWPFRKLFGSAGEPARDQELQVIDTALEHCLLSLRSEVLTRRHPWWRALAEELVGCEPDMRRRFGDAVDDYRRDFQPRIDRLSEDLYQQLERNPVTLNALRATRLGADAGGIVLAIKTGTLGVYDALFAPAVISLTSYLTESAVGQYLRTVIARLKREQTERMSGVLQETIEQPLRALRPRGEGLFGVTEAELSRAMELMRELGP